MFASRRLTTHEDVLLRAIHDADAKGKAFAAAKDEAIRATERAKAAHRAMKEAERWLAEVRSGRY